MEGGWGLRDTRGYEAEREPQTMAGWQQLFPYIVLLKSSRKMVVYQHGIVTFRTNTATYTTTSARDFSASPSPPYSRMSSEKRSDRAGGRYESSIWQGDKDFRRRSRSPRQDHRGTIPCVCMCLSVCVLTNSNDRRSISNSVRTKNNKNKKISLRRLPLSAEPLC